MSKSIFRGSFEDLIVLGSLPCIVIDLLADCSHIFLEHPKHLGEALVPKIDVRSIHFVQYELITFVTFFA